MKSLYISYDGALEPLGQSQIIPYLKGLASPDLKFILLTFDKPGYASREARESLRLELEKAGIIWVSLTYHRRPAVLSTFFDIAVGLLYCCYFIRKDKVGIVHARGYVSAMIACILKKCFKVKFIFDMRGFWADLKAECGQWRAGGIVYKTAKYYESVFLKRCDEIVVLTNSARGLLLSRGCTHCKISVIPCCVATDTFKSNDHGCSGLRIKDSLKDKFIFAHAGSLEPWYMMEEMLDFFKAVKPLIPNAHFLILSHSPKSKITRLISDKGLSMDDFSVAAAEFKDMPAWLTSVNAGLIFLSLGFSKAGCCPTKFAEFLSCGVPVIASAGIGDLDDIIKADKVGVVIDAFDRDHYRCSAAELLKLENDGGLNQRCRDTAVREFSLSAGVKKYQDVYNKLRLC